MAKQGEYKREEKPPPSPTSFAAKILRGLLKLVAELGEQRPDKKSNKEQILADMFIWDEIAAYAKRQSDGLWKQQQELGFYDDTDLDVGEHLLAESTTFALACKVSMPVRRYNADKLQEILTKSRYKIPPPVARKMAEDAKVPGKSAHTLSIAERS